MSDGSRMSMRYLTEITRGTTPANDPGWKTVRYSGAEDLSAVPETSASEEVRGDRNISDMSILAIDPQGGIPGEYSATTWDDWLESLFFSTWSTNVLKNGTTVKSFSIEKYFEDIARYINFKGCIASSCAFELPAQGRGTMQWQFMGIGLDAPSATSAVGTGSVAAAGTTRTLVGTDFTLDEIDSVAPTTEIITNVSMNIDNGLSKVAGWGSPYPQDHATSPIAVTGTISALLDVATLSWYSDTLTQADKQLKFTLSDGTNSHEWELPKLRFGTPTPSGAGNGNTILVNAEFQGLYNVADLATVIITRAP